jgi:hypothetical protein
MSFLTAGFSLAARLFSNRFYQGQIVLDAVAIGRGEESDRKRL